MEIALYMLLGFVGGNFVLFVLFVVAAMTLDWR